MEKMSLEYALSNRRLADRFFGSVTQLFPDGCVMLRRLDGRGDVLIDAPTAASIGVDLHVGMRIEFELRDGCARDPCTLEAGQRRLGVVSN
jgi:hypothetical protein